MSRILEITFSIELAEDDGSDVATVADILADSLSSDVVQDEIVAGSDCEVLLGAVTVLSAKAAQS